MSLLSARPTSSSFVVDDPCFLDVDERPDWQTHFGNNQPVKLEIGFGMGDFLIEMAAREPNNNFVGIDFSQDCVRKLLAQINNLHLKNIRVLYGDVREKLPRLFLDDELDTVYINLPDPWPRKRHFKRRLVKPDLVNLIARKLVPNGHVYLATDSESYAREMLDYFDTEPLLKNKNPQLGILENRYHLPKSKYEKSFIYAGDKIHYLEYTRLSPVEQNENEVSSSKNKDIGLKETPEHSLSKDERLIKKFQEDEARANDACDLKQLGDNLVYAGDRQWGERVYKKAEGRAEDSLDLNWLAYSVSEALGDKNWAKKLYEQAEEKAESSLDLNWLAFSITETLGDKEWAKKLYKKAESDPDNIRELCDLADSISETFADREWQIRVYKKAASMAKEHSEFYELADSIYAKLGDEAWSRELYKKAEETAEDSSDLLGLVESLCVKLGDQVWARKVFLKAEDLAQDSNDFCCLAESICKMLGDQELAGKLYEKAEEKASDNIEYRWLADSLNETLGNQQWANAVHQKIK
ncbi:MAG: tRNA (guanosine(46)-N7)-methyltransferase TrmB [Nitrospinae bacterium]|nr:tRNA (guanosine(46)-N7)-methyltransferase TrmB [Nitrospinota bacterium]